MFVYTEFYHKNSQYSLVTLCPGQTIKKCLLSLSLWKLCWQSSYWCCTPPPPPGGGGDSGRGEGLSIIHSLPFPPTFHPTFVRKRENFTFNKAQQAKNAAKFGPGAVPFYTRPSLSDWPRLCRAHSNPPAPPRKLCGNYRQYIGLGNCSNYQGRVSRSSCSSNSNSSLYTVKNFVSTNFDF